MKARLKGAQTGRNLLKKKADALTIRFRQILKRIIETKQLMGTVMKEAALSLAEAKFTMGDFSQQILQNVNKASIKIKAKRDNVAGVQLAIFESYKDGNSESSSGHSVVKSIFDYLNFLHSTSHDGLDRLVQRWSANEEAAREL